MVNEWWVQEGTAVQVRCHYYINQTYVNNNNNNIVVERRGRNRRRKRRMYNCTLFVVAAADDDDDEDDDTVNMNRSFSPAVILFFLPISTSHKKENNERKVLHSNVGLSNRITPP